VKVSSEPEWGLVAGSPDRCNRGSKHILSFAAGAGYVRVTVREHRDVVIRLESTSPIRGPDQIAVETARQDGFVRILDADDGS
jgi:hypothetical protein